MGNRIADVSIPASSACVFVSLKIQKNTSGWRSNVDDEDCQFEKWFAGLPDMRTRDRIDTRIGRLEAGSPGDVRPIGKGASELRFFFGSGYRVYFHQERDDLVLLNGGDTSTQN